MNPSLALSAASSPGKSGGARSCHWRWLCQTGWGRNAVPVQPGECRGWKLLIRDVGSVQERKSAVSGIALLRSGFKNKRLKKRPNCHDIQNSISSHLEMWLSREAGKIYFSATAAFPWEGTVAYPAISII